VRDPAAKRTPIRPAAIDDLPEVGRWLHDRMTGAGQGELSERITYLFGHAECPYCGRGLRVHEAIEKDIW